MSKLDEKVNVKPITLRDTETGDTYILEFNRDSVKFAEDRGFVIDDVSKFPMTKWHELFYYAFHMHHPRVSKANTDKILDEELGGITALPDGFLERLVELYGAAFEPLVDTSKNSKVQIEM